MLWMHYLVGVSHFAKYGTNQPLTAWEMLTNVQKSPIPQWWRKWKSDPEFTCRSRSPSKVNHFQRITSCLCLPSLVDADFRVRQLSCLQNDRQNDHITSALLTKVTMLMCRYHAKMSYLRPRDEYRAKFRMIRAEVRWTCFVKGPSLGSCTTIRYHHH